MPRSSARDRALAAHLDALYAVTDGASRVAHDPVRAVHRYTDPADQEVAGFVAAGLAFGRVDLFLPVLDAVLDGLDRRGGPAAAVRAWSVADDALLSGVGYRWIRPPHLAVVLAMLGGALREAGRLETLFRGDGPLRDRMADAVDRLRGHAAAALAQRETPAPPHDLPRGVRTFVPSPRDGSACKRLNLWLRWMVRPPTEGVDVGAWTAVQPHELVMPVDVHVGRLARFLGLTGRTDASWRTAEEITASLRRWDARDPVRYDFALAHLGISGACVGRRDPAICPSCPLDPVCRAPGPTTGSRRALR